MIPCSALYRLMHTYMEFTCARVRDTSPKPPKSSASAQRPRVPGGGAPGAAASAALRRSMKKRAGANWSASYVSAVIISGAAGVRPKL